MAISMSNDARIAAVAALLSALFTPSLLEAQTLPGGTIVQIRLRQTVSSFGSRSGDEIRSIVIAPVVLEGAIVIPQGAEILGTVYDVRRVGMGLSRESAWIKLDFDTLRLPGGRNMAIAGRIVEVDNARETIDAEGRVRGIRATASMSSTLSGLAVIATSFDPMMLAFGLSSSLSMFRIPESEIILPVGAELHFETTQPLALTAKYPPAAPGFANSSGQRAQIEAIIRDLPYRTATIDTNVPSDLTTLAFLGSEEALRAAFDAAGWSESDARNTRSTYAAIRSVIENQGYKEAPMSTLLLDGKPPILTYSKTLNTFFKRHHLRIFATKAAFEAQSLWTSSATHDTGIGFSTNQKTFIHLIDQNIDEEREKVLNDLILTGCVTGVDLIARPWVPLDAFNATGDKLVTDGRIALVRLNDCANPTRDDVPAPGAQDVGTRPVAPARAARDALLSLRNDVLRGNIFYQGYQGIHLGVKAVKSRNARKSPSAQPSSLHVGGQTWQIVRGPQKLAQLPNAPEDPDQQGPSFRAATTHPESWETFLEFSISGGYARFGNSMFSTQPVIINVPAEAGPIVSLPAEFVTSLGAGWNLTGNTTFNAHKYLSHELGFTYNSSTLSAVLENPELGLHGVAKADANIRQFSY